MFYCEATTALRSTQEIADTRVLRKVHYESIKATTSLNDEQGNISWTNHFLFSKTHGFSKIKNFCLAAIIALSATLPIKSAASPLSIKSKGEFFFSPPLTEKIACEAARQAAVEDALRRLRMESFTTETPFSCKTTRDSLNDSETCTLHRSTWSQLGEDIRSSATLAKFVFKVENIPNVLRCFVEVDVVLNQRPKPVNPKIDFLVRLNKNIYLTGDDLQIQISSKQKINLAIFSWTPNQNKNVVHRIFPNDIDSSPVIDGVKIIPNNSADKSYRLEVTFPERFEKNFSDEYLLFIATKKEMAWREVYDMKDLNDKLRDLKPDDKQIHRRAYKVVQTL